MAFLKIMTYKKEVGRPSEEDKGQVGANRPFKAL